MSVRILANVHTLAHFARQHLPGIPPFRDMSVLILEKDLILVIYAMRALLIRLVLYTTSVLILAKSLLSVLYAAAGLCMVATATVIKNVVGARGSRFMKNAWDVICRLKALILDARS